MTEISRKPLGADEPLNIDFTALPRERLDRMEAAVHEIVDSYEALRDAETTITGEILKGQGDFVQWDHYPAGDVYDWSSHSQYYYHAHPPDNRANVWGAEHGHFHTFLRAQGMPPGAAPADIPGNAQSDDPNDALSHIIAISMSRDGLPVRLFTTNRWVTSEQWHDADAVISMIDCFRISSGVPSRPVNVWISAMLQLFHPQIDALLRRRDAVLSDWQARFPDADRSAYDDRDLEVTSITDISVEQQVSQLGDELQRRRIARS
jgi:hypothetical protein